MVAFENVAAFCPVALLSLGRGEVADLASKLSLGVEQYRARSSDTLSRDELDHAVFNLDALRCGTWAGEASECVLASLSVFTLDLDHVHPAA